MMAKDNVSTISLLLANLPYDFRFAKYSGPEGGYQVELYQGDVVGSGISEDSLCMAYTRAEVDLATKLKRAEAEYAATIADFEAGYGRL